MRRSDFTYELPEELIAQQPLAERSASRLLTLDGATGALADRQIRDLPQLVSPGDLLVFNYLTVHGSGLNVSDEPRTTWLVQIRDPEDEPISERHQSRGQGMMLAGIDPRTEAFRFAWEGQTAA